MRMKINPFAEGRALAGETMSNAYPRMFSLITDYDIAQSKLSRARCEVFIMPENPKVLLANKILMTCAYESLKRKDTLKILWTSSFGIGLTSLMTILHLVSEKSAERAIAEALALAVIINSFYRLLKKISFILEMKKLMKSAMAAIDRYPDGMPTREI
jgi:hypothetical protein